MSKYRIASIFYCPFTGLGLYGGYRGDRWLKNRIRVFKSFVIPSLVNQTDRNFILWCQWRPEEKENPTVKDFMDHLNHVRGLSVIHTFHGITIWDDKLDDHEASRKLLNSLKASLPEIEGHVAESDWVYLTCQPSDDMYCSDAVRRIRSCKPAEKTAVGWRNGYMVNCATKELAEYDPDTTPPFATIIFPTETFLDPERHYKYIGPFKSHEEVSWRFDYHDLGGRGYCVGTGHNTNISTVWVHPYKGREVIDDFEKMKVMLDFGIWHSEPVIVRQGWRLWGRCLVNSLPRPMHDLIKTYYHKLRKSYYDNFR